MGIVDIDGQPVHRASAAGAHCLKSLKGFRFGICTATYLVPRHTLSSIMATLIDTEFMHTQLATYTQFRLNRLRPPSSPSEPLRSSASMT